MVDSYFYVMFAKEAWETSHFGFAEDNCVNFEMLQPDLMYAMLMVSQTLSQQHTCGFPLPFLTRLFLAKNLEAVRRLSNISSRRRPPATRKTNALCRGADIFQGQTKYWGSTRNADSTSRKENSSINNEGSLDLSSKIYDHNSNQLSYDLLVYCR